MEPVSVAQSLRRAGVNFESVRTIDPCKVLITFKSEKECNETMENDRETFLSIVYDFRKWLEEDMEKIGDVLGKVVQVDFTTCDLSNFKSVRVQIDKVLSPINA